MPAASGVVVFVAARLDRNAVDEQREQRRDAGEDDVCPRVNACFHAVAEGRWRARWTVELRLSCYPAICTEPGNQPEPPSIRETHWRADMAEKTTTGTTDRRRRRHTFDRLLFLQWYGITVGGARRAAQFDSPATRSTSAAGRSLDFGDFVFFDRRTARDRAGRARHLRPRDRAARSTSDSVLTCRRHHFGALDDSADHRQARWRHAGHRRHRLEVRHLRCADRRCADRLRWIHPDAEEEGDAAMQPTQRPVSSAHAAGSARRSAASAAPPAPAPLRQQAPPAAPPQPAAAGAATTGTARTSGPAASGQPPQPGPPAPPAV